jgi:hypothetical protein
MKTLISYAYKFESPLSKLVWRWDLTKVLLVITTSLFANSFDYELHYQLRDKRISNEKIELARMFSSYGYSLRDELTTEVVSRKLFKNKSYSFGKAKRFNSASDANYYSSFSKRRIERRLLKTIPYQFRKNARSYIRPILKLSEKYQIDPFWVVSIIWTESHFKSRARSAVGATGLMQIMPKTRKYLLRILKIKRVRLEAKKKKRYLRFLMGPYKKLGYRFYKKNLINLELGVYYLKKLLHRFAGNHKYATVAYNMGPTWTVRRLKNRLPVGNKNVYINKVNRAYKQIDSKFVNL